MNSLSSLLSMSHKKVSLVLARFTSTTNRSWCLGQIAHGGTMHKKGINWQYSEDYNVFLNGKN
jgi:hypothetical protein